jgi:phosphoribosylformylglycinamidine synthase
MPKILVRIEYLDGVEDPESETVLKNLRSIGFDSVASVRISRSFEFSLTGNEKEAMKSVKEISDKLLYNPVIQKFTIQKISD